MPTFTRASPSRPLDRCGRHRGAYGTRGARTSGGSVGGRHLAGLLVLLDRLFQIRVLRARQEAERVEAGQMLLGLGDVAEHQVGLADVLVGPPMLGVDRQRLFVEGQRGSGITSSTRGRCGMATTPRW